MTAHQLARALLGLPDIEVGDDDGRLVGSLGPSTYDAGDGRDTPYIALHLDRG